MTDNHDLPPLPILSKQEEIWCHCRLSIFNLVECAGEDWVDAKFAAMAIAEALGIAFDEDNLEEIIVAGLQDERTFETAVQAHKDLSRSGAFVEARISICEDMLHEYEPNEDGDRVCRFCGVYDDGEEQGSKYEAIEESELDLLPKAPHPLAR